MSDVWENAKANAKPDCPQCHGQGQWIYTTYGTPHGTICNLCCKHNMGWWQLSECHGAENAGKWCCKAGCGYTVLERPVEPDVTE